MSRPALLAIGLGAASAFAGCDARDAAASVLAALGQPSFREVDAAQARALLGAGGVRLVQARGEDNPAQRVDGAALLGTDAPLGDLPEADRIVIVAEEADLALRLGARLARAGGTRVAVVSGGLPSWGPDAKEE